VSKPPPEYGDDSPLGVNWDKPLSELVELEHRRRALEASEKERYRIYSLAVMALVKRYWNGNKYRKNLQAGTEEYPQRMAQLLAVAPANPPAQPTHVTVYEGGDYEGHNICCLAVGRSGRIIDFDFNHNELFNSSAEHAEARLVRRLFSLTALPDYRRRHLGVIPEDPDDDYYGSSLKNVTLFTSLESCAQCSGIMALGAVKEVVYIQRDPGMYMIGNLLHKLTTDSLRAPRPVRAAEFGFTFGDELDRAFGEFRDTMHDEPFCLGIDLEGDYFENRSPSVTSFLCTDAALDIFERAAEGLESGALELAHPAFRPEHGALTNEGVLANARAFVAYACDVGRRGTPHHV
jgi:tRNA(Arg) A34 adenosine deaminase TadA